MKLISFCVPSYNSAAYLDRCIQTLLKGGDEVEIIIINDGSVDETPIMADNYQKQYPSIVRVVHQENQGHGKGLLVGIEEARGKYFKVLDSDDWVDEEALKTLLQTINQFINNNEEPDLIVTNYVNVNIVDHTKRAVDFKKQFTPNHIFTWGEHADFKKTAVMIMHGLAYKLSTLRESKLQLPLRTYYEDIIYSYYPLPFIKTLYYLDVNLYQYCVGRSDQSISTDNLAKNYLQYIKILRECYFSYSFKQLTTLNPGLTKYMLRYLIVYTVVTITSTSLNSNAKSNKERKENLQNLFHELKIRDLPLYKKIKANPILALIMPLPFGFRRFLLRFLYKIMNKKLKFG